MKRILLFFALALTLLGVVAVALPVVVNLLPLGTPTTVKVGRAAPGLQLPSLRDSQPGDTLALDSFRGKPVLVNFWATWCGPCRAEMPALQQLYSKYKDSLGLVVLGVNEQEEAAQAQAFLTQLGITFPIVLDRDGAAEETYLIQGLPTTFVIDRQGVVRDLLIGGPLTEDRLEQELEKIR